MFDHILISLDGSTEARTAGELGLRLAKRVGARVTGLSVVDVRVVEGPAIETLSPLWGAVTGRPFQPEVMRLRRERADSALDDFCSTAAAAGLTRIERRVEIGVAEATILQQAADADLLVMGRRGEHAGLRRPAVGATLWRTIHRSPCPVLVGADLGQTEDVEPQRRVPQLPLVAWDCTAGGRAALHSAIDFASTTGSALRLVHAGRESDDAKLDEAHEVLASSALDWASARIAARPADAIAEAANRWNTDCLFMRAFGRGRMRGFFFGSHTAQILGCFSSPVFVIP